MSKISIFEKEQDGLFAARFEPNQKDELDKALDFWRDVEQLRAFFIQHQKDLSKFAIDINVKDAVKLVLDESSTIYDNLKKFSEGDNLDELFKPLDDRETAETRYEYQKAKAKSGLRKGMLRIYAVKFRDWYVITGGAIKLVDHMNDRPYLKTELYKLELVRKILQEGNTEGSFVYLDAR